jgi:hypothetical protein
MFILNPLTHSCNVFKKTILELEYTYHTHLNPISQRLQGGRYRRPAIPETLGNVAVIHTTTISVGKCLICSGFFRPSLVKYPYIVLPFNMSRRYYQQLYLSTMAFSSDVNTLMYSAVQPQTLPVPSITRFPSEHILIGPLAEHRLPTPAI